MSGEKIIRALDAIPDEQLQSAMGVYERRKKLKYIWVRVIIVLIVLAVVLFFLRRPASQWMADVDLTGFAYTEQHVDGVENTLLPDGPLLGVASWSYPSAPADPAKDPLRGKITTDLAEEIRDCIQDLSLRSAQWREVYGKGMMLSFGYEDGSIEYLQLIMRDDGNVYLSTWSWDTFYGKEKVRNFQLDNAQAAYLLDLIYEMLEQSEQTA